MHIPLCLLVAVASVVSMGRSQHLLHDDFTAAQIDPARWSITTPMGSSAVFVQNGECVLQDRGYLVTVAQFDPVAMGGLEVRGKFRFGGTYDYISILTRCDGIPTAPFGNAQNGVALDISWETAPHFFLSSRSPQIQAGPSQWIGGGFQPVPGTSYAFELVDDGQQVRARVEGPNGQWVQLQLPILGDTTTAKHVVFHNREPVPSGHQCFLDDVSIGPPEQRWRLAATAFAPPSPRGVAMAFDRHRGRTVLFGGCQVEYPFYAISGVSAETWEWDGAAWHQVATANAPSPRFFHSMVYDVARRRMVMFGGRGANGTNPADTTWEYDGHDWTNVTPATGPVPREMAAMAYDEARQQVVLFGGGYAGSSGNLADTWTWNGMQWTQQFPQQAPTGRFGHALAYDPAGERVLMFGGTIPWGFEDDLWQWDGANWNELFPTSSLPVARHYHAIAFDPTRDQLLLFGGNPGNYQPHVGDTWTWSDNAWTQAVTSPAPSPRAYPAMVFDSVRREFVLFGGAEFGFGPQGNPTDTWLYKSDEAWFATFGAGCPGSNNLPPALSAGGGNPPVLGETFALRVRQLPLLTLVAAFMGTSIVNDGPTALPRDLTGIGMTGCMQWVSLVQLRLLLGLGGQAQWRIPIPDTASLLGTRSYYQALVLDWGANPLGVTISDAAAATIGW